MAGDGMKEKLKRVGTAVIVLLILILNYSGAVYAEETPPPSVSARAFILMDANSGRTICAGAESERLPMASTTKIMSALITLEQKNLDEYFTVDPDAIKIEGSSMGLLEGDQVSLRMLAYGMLLPSGNDAANAAAVQIAGSQEKFADMMNAKAKKLGMKDTHFVTPSGLHNEEHYTTAYDMAVLAKAALENKAFAEICRMPKAQVKFGNPPFERWLSNHNRLLSSYDGCIGMKTGFTKAAGRCLVSAAERNGMKLICVTLNDPRDWTDHVALLDFGFAAAEEVTLKPELEDVRLNVVGAKKKQIQVSAAPELTATVPVAADGAEQQVLMDRFVYAPVKKGDVVGTVNFTVNGSVVASTPLLAGQDAAQHITEVKQDISLWERFCHFLDGLF